MDNLTHALSGALIARATAPRPRPGTTIPLARRVALGVVAASLPDLDFVVGWLSPVAYLYHHRGITHSFLMLPLWSLLLAWVCAKLWREGPGWRAYFSVFAWGIGIHIAGDWITSFGTMLLAPLSDQRFALSTTFIIDLWLLGILLAGAIGCLAWRASRMPAVFGLALTVGYVAFQGMQHEKAIAFGEHYASAEGMQGATVRAIPRPASPYNWTVLVEDADRVDYAQIRFDAQPALLGRIGVPLFTQLAAPYVPARDAQWVRVDRFGPDAVVRDAFAAPELAFFRWFAAHPALYRIDRGNPSTCVWFEDLRFVTPGRSETPFRYGLCRETNGPWSLFKLDGDQPIPVR